MIFEIEGAGLSEIKNPQKLLELRKRTYAAMKEKLEDTKVFSEVDFLPDILLPPDGPKDLKTLYIGAARANADGILVYSTESDYQYDPNGLCIFYPTIIGVFISTGSRAFSTSLSKSILIDVKTGFIYSIIEAYGDSDSGILPVAYISPEQLEIKSRTNTVEALSKRVAEKVLNLKK